MTDYRKPNSVLIFDLIEESNPGFKTKYDIAKLTISAPTPIVVDPDDPYRRDSLVTIRGGAGSNIVGAQQVSYRRINLATFTRGTLWTTDQFVPPATTLLTSDMYVPYLSKKYGVGFTAEDFPAPSVGRLTTGVTATVSVNDTSLCYTGSFRVLWNKGKQSLVDYFGKSQVALDALFWNAVDGFEKPKGEFLTFSMDFSDIPNITPGFTQPVFVPANNTHQLPKDIVAYMRTLSPEWDWNIGDSTTQGGIEALTWSRFDLPHASVPEANSDDYTGCWAIPAAAGSWFTGKLILHFGRRS